MSPSALRQFLDQLLDARLMLSLMIWGPPGVGKSSIVREAASARALPCIDLRLSQLAPTDLRGLPVPQDGLSSWLPPDFLPRDGQGVLFLDEINMAPPAVQGVAQQLVLDRRVGNYRLPEGWFVWAAGNRREDRGAVFDMPAPLANRFIHLEVSPSLEDFRRYALAEGFDETLTAFLNFRPQLLHRFDAHQLAWPSPRSWAMANSLLGAGLALSPAVGEAAAAEFAAYRALVANIPDLSDILQGKANQHFPAEPSLCYAVVIGLVSRASDATRAANALAWLVREAGSEWVQLFASDMFALLRARGQLAAFNKKVLKDDGLRDFLSTYTQLLLD